MSESHIDYQALVHKALRGAVREILLILEAKGLQGEHHYYITFKTEAEGVDVPKRMKTQYPHEMTIVIQHRYWDLKVHDDRFEIGLSFNQRPEHLVIPFEAITSLVDPSQRFALQFDAKAEEEVEEGQLFDHLTPEKDAPAPETEADQKIDEKNQDNVVALDAFRKS
ncbi:MAG: hypothetical protein IIA70_04055 [Proteobacteria bacterium]|nr:hypothetical protein [Pseudomonadota bacterium]